MLKHIILQFFFLASVYGSNPKALIFGGTGQDGTYLTNFLLGKNYEVHSVSRCSVFKEEFLPKLQVEEIRDNNPYFYYHIGNIVDYTTVLNIIREIQPDEIYNLAAQSSVKKSFDHPMETSEVNAIGALHILEALRALEMEKKVRYFQAATSEMYGAAKEIPQTEQTPFCPRSPYGISKLYSYWITVNYREAYGLFACNGIMFNHESPLRPETFVSRKITQAVCQYKLGLRDTLYLGNLDAKRDWGYAGDFVEAMWLMLQQDKPDDYVIATGVWHSVREFVELAFHCLDIEIEWQGEGVDELGIDKRNGNAIVKIDPKFYRPVEGCYTLGDPSKAEKKLKWKSKTTFQELLEIMIKAEFERLQFK